MKSGAFVDLIGTSEVNDKRGVFVNHRGSTGQSTKRINETNTERKDPGDLPGPSQQRGGNETSTHHYLSHL